MRFTRGTATRYLDSLSTIDRQRDPHPSTLACDHTRPTRDIRLPSARPAQRDGFLKSAIIKSI